MAELALSPFVWGSGGEKLTPDQLDRRRKVADALRQREGYVPAGWMSLLGGLAGEGVASYKEAEIDKQESEAQQRVADALMQARSGGDPNAYLDVMGDPFATPQQSAIAQAMYQQGQPDYQTIESGGDVYRFNRNDPNSQPELWFDGPSAAPEPPKTVTVFDPATGREKVQQWNPAINDWEDLGGVQAPKEPLVEVNTGDNSSAFGKKADETAAVRMNDIVAAGAGAQNFMGDLQALTEIGKNLDTGKGAEIVAALGPYAEALGVKIDGLGEAQAYDAIVSRMAPQMRVPGSGASSDFDAKQFLKSLPGLGKAPGGNALIIQTFQAIQQAKVAAADIASQALNGEITWQEADQKMREIGDPFTAFNEYRKAVEQPSADEGWTELAPGVRIRKKAD